jgi:four helix bundle protein
LRDFRGLKVWEKAHALTLATYRVTREFPREETYGLTSRIRRAGLSISANIAQGCGRDGDCDLARFLRIAMGRAAELQYHLLLARDLGLLESGDYQQLDEASGEIKRMLTGLMRRLDAERW